MHSGRASLLPDMCSILTPLLQHLEECVDIPYSADTLLTPAQHSCLALSLYIRQTAMADDVPSATEPNTSLLDPARSQLRHKSAETDTVTERET